MNAAIEKLKNDFVVQLTAAARAEANEEVLEKLTAPVIRFGASKAGKVIKLPVASVPKKARKKPPIQLCPVPNCTGRAAPSLGMVCLKHKAVPKAQIKKYRELRRAKAAKKAA